MTVEMNIEFYNQIFFNMKNVSQGFQAFRIAMLRKVQVKSIPT